MTTVLLHEGSAAPKLEPRPPPPGGGGRGRDPPQNPQPPDKATAQVVG